MVIEPFPKRRQPALDLQLPHYTLAEVLRSSVCAQSHEKASIYTFFLHTSLSLLLSCYSIPFSPSGLFLLLGLTWSLMRCLVGIAISTDV